MFQHLDFPNYSFQVLYEQLVYRSKHANFIIAGQYYKRIVWKHMGTLTNFLSNEIFHRTIEVPS